jgi:peptidyl-prolyl cis-trans isomerase A (cyclophilin A)
MNARTAIAAAALIAGALLMLAASVTARARAQAEPQMVRVRFETALGVFEVALDAVRAPVTVANFLKYIDGGFYDGGRMHRSARLETQTARPVKIEVIQAGINPQREGDKFPEIPLERTSATGVSHKNGTISMARSGPDTATSDFFICIGDQPSLDFGGARNPDGQGFAAFGRVVAGMDVVRAIHRAPAEGETLKPPVTILTARRIRPGEAPGQFFVAVHHETPCAIDGALNARGRLPFPSSLTQPGEPATCAQLASLRFDLRPAVR